jgi:glycosyltransferase involved in cell wall biosynthesis
MCFATQGEGSRDEDRIRALLAPLRPTVFPFRRGAKIASAARLVARAWRDRPDVIVMEGTGIAGGAALLLLRAAARTRYVVSSGDAVAPYLGGRAPWLRPFAALYERLLCRLSAGFIGWTPYLVGRALTFGAPRAMTAPGWAPFSARADARDELRERLGIAEDAVVFGIVGSLDWNARVGYCYGWELIQAVRGVRDRPVVALVVGDGSGLDHLREAAAGMNGQVVFTGRVPRDEVPAYLSAMDVGSLPQSVDGVGSFRYTTKVSEYAEAGLPIVTGEIPLAYDLDGGGLWRLPGDAPWDRRYIESMTQLMERLEPREIDGKRAAARSRGELFRLETQQSQVASFVESITERPVR